MLILAWFYDVFTMYLLLFIWDINIFLSFYLHITVLYIYIYILLPCNTYISVVQVRAVVTSLLSERPPWAAGTVQPRTT